MHRARAFAVVAVLLASCPEVGCFDRTTHFPDSASQRRTDEFGRSRRTAPLSSSTSRPAEDAPAPDDRERVSLDLLQRRAELQRSLDVIAMRIHSDEATIDQMDTSERPELEAPRRRIEARLEELDEQRRSIQAQLDALPR